MRKKIRKISPDRLPKMTEAERIELMVAPIRTRYFDRLVEDEIFDPVEVAK